jgi:histidinol dehydrogenase
MTAQATASVFGISGSLDELSGQQLSELFDRAIDDVEDVASATREIIARVRREGDDALRDFARQFDKAELAELEISQSRAQEAFDAVDCDFKRALERSAANIRRVHEAQLPVEVALEVEPGVVVRRRPDPLDRVGIYAPGGTAAYASSVLMSAIPAKVAGVREVILCSPPSPDGFPAPQVLAAACVADVDRIFAIGGAGAIAAMAMGTASVPRVDKITGPGNAYVAEAKMQLMSKVAIDSPAGPSELLVIADDTSDADVVAREVLAQAEHDAAAVVGVVCIGTSLPARIEAAVSEQVELAPRRQIIREALRRRGFLVAVGNPDEATRLATGFAPEHLLIVAQDADVIAQNVRGAGAAFVGEASSVAFGDYITGANHVLPTGGLGRAYSGLSTLDFMRWTTIQKVTRAGAESLAADASAFAKAEGLPAHAAAAGFWRSRG